MKNRMLGEYQEFEEGVINIYYIYIFVNNIYSYVIS